jgi:aminopeptidase N
MKGLKSIIIVNHSNKVGFFYGITYSKGASVIRQLLSIMGCEEFGKACLSPNAVLKKH